jgi:hypothetical protein
MFAEKGLAIPLSPLQAAGLSDGVKMADDRHYLSIPFQTIRR